MSENILAIDDGGGTGQQHLHDLLSIGEIETALSSSKLPSLNDDEFSSACTTAETGLGIRLPFLLRCLAASQPRSSVASSFDVTCRDDPPARQGSSYTDLDVIVRLLEDVAAAHRGAENVEILVSTLAPSLCRETIGKVPPLSRCKVNKLSFYNVNTKGSVDEDYPIWNTAQLNDALDSLSHHGVAISNKRGHKEQQLPRKRRKIQSKDTYNSSSFTCEDNAEIDESANEDEDDPVPSQLADCTDKDCIAGKQEDSSLLSFFERASSAANDSYESAMRRTLQELIHLVKSSLISSRQSSFDCGAVENEGNEDKSLANENSFCRETGFRIPGLSIKSESLFAETNPVYSSFGGGCSSLSVMVLTLMYHAPVLRHQHVANALCRAAAPQASSLIKHMAANCPVAIPCLLRGVIKAYKLAERYKYLKPKASSNRTDEVDSMGPGPEVSDIIQTSLESAKSIASLSPSEAYRVICMLREQEVMNELVMSLLLDHDPIGAASFIVEKLSTTYGCHEPKQSSLSTAPTQEAARRNSMSDNLKTSSKDASVTSEMEEQQRTHPLPLRQRMLSRRLQSNSAASLTNFASTQRFSQSQLSRALIDDWSLAERCTQCISTEIAAFVDRKQKSSNCSSVSYGVAVLLLWAFALLAHCPVQWDSTFVTDVIGRIPCLFESESTKSQMPKSSSDDDLYKLAFCATIIVWSKFLLVDDSEAPAKSEIVSEVCQECIRSLLVRPKSLECLVFSSRFSGFVINNDAKGASSIILSHIYSRNHVCAGASLELELKQMSNVIFCIQASIGNEQLEHLHEAALSLNSVLYNPVVVIDVMKRDDPRRFNKLNDLVNDIFSDPKSCRDILCKPMTCELIQESVKMVLRRTGPHIPHVVPFSLERVAASIPWSLSYTSDFHELFPQFVIQLLYALLFLENEPTSPFAINPRSFPLKETLSFVESLYTDSDHRYYDKVDGHRALCHLLEKLMSSHCADVVHCVERSRLLNHRASPIFSHESITPSKVHLAVRDCLDKDGVVDPSGIRAEKMYLMSRSHYLTSALDVAVVSALLSSRLSQPKFFSYLALCKDPLVMFKAPASVWKCHGIRRIFLNTLHHLLEANESIITKCCESLRVSHEFLAARDTIIVRCLLLAQTEFSPTHCVMSVNMVRRIISRCPGFVATLLKQGLDDRFVDYLCEFVPETFSDAMILSSILSEKALLSSSERLGLADASLRIAVSHSLRGEMAAKRLASVSLLILIESFHLVIGPVGVPVSVLRQVNGHDATDTCRNAMFRMLSMLSTINPNSALKGPAISAIGKIASMCKNESTSVGASGSTAARRKSLLKEIWEACSCANLALGGEIQI